MSTANYGGKIPNDTAYIKQFFYGAPTNLWKTYSYTPINEASIEVITPTSGKFANVYIPGNLYIDGSIINPSDIHLKNNITEINNEQTNKLMNLKATSFNFKYDSGQNIHYGFIAQDFEKEYPELVSIKPDKNMSNVKAINYLEMIPLLVNKMQMMQKEIDELKAEVTKLKS